MNRRHQQAEPAGSGNWPGGEPLQALIEEWQPGLDTSPDFAAQLNRRIAAAPARRHAGLIGAWRRMFAFDSSSRLAPAWGRWAGGATVAVALLLMVVFLRFGRNRPVPPAVATAKAAVAVQPGAVVRDLQALNQDQDLIQNLNFLSLPENGSKGAEE